MGCARGRDDGGRDVRHRDDRRCSVAEPAAIEQRVRAAVREACIRHAMVQPEDTVLVALSGGQDSLCLLHVLCGLRAEMQTRLLAGHLHHGMRGAQADRDVRVLEGICAEWRVPFHWERVPVGEMAAERAVSVEEAGREARYDFLQRLATEHGAERIATGHTATDRAETVLMHILRGSGLDGLRGIPAVNGNVIRPLCGVTREETGLYCESLGLRTLWDCTNEDTEAYLRNRVRLKLLPLLEEQYAPGVVDALLRLSAAAEEELAWTQPIVSAHLAGLGRVGAEGAELDVEGLRALGPGLRARVLRQALQAMRGTLEGFARAHLEAINCLVEAPCGTGVLHLPFEIRVERSYNRLALGYGEPDAAEADEWEFGLAVPAVVLLPGGGLLRTELCEAPADLTGPRTAYLDAEAAGGGLLVRRWREGDRVRPLGMTGSKKLQDLFVDRKVPRRERRKVPVVVGSGGEILWVAGLCVGRAAAVRPDSRHVVRLEWEPAAGCGPGPADTDARA